METEPFYFGAYCLEPANARLLKGENTVPLPPKALAALIYLVEHRGRLVGKDELLDAVWGHRFVSQGVLKNTITTLRQTLGDDPKNPLYIETVHRLGYRFIAEVESSPSSPQKSLAMVGPTATLQAPLNLVGRAAPLAELDRLLASAALGKPQMTFVTGEPGIGKTSLIEAFLQSVAHRVLMGRGQCVEQYGQGEPYLPVLEALNDLMRQDEARLSTLLRQVAPTWLAQLPWYLNETDQPLLQQVLAGSTQLRMLREFGEFLDRCSMDRPLVLILEDLHWSDRATQDLLAYLARRKQPARWLILGSYRPEDIILTSHDSKRMLRELQIQGLCTELALEPLSEAAIGDYLQQCLDTPPPDDAWARILHTRSGGLPFFLVQLVETVRAEQAPDGDAAMQTSALPEGVQQLLARRFERLSDAHRRTLEAASVIGMNFSAEAIAATLAVDSVEVEQCCETLARLRYFIQHGGALSDYVFRHAFHREFAYGQLLPLQASRLHLRIGQWLESSRSEEMASELALHFERGRDWEKAVKYLHRAATNAVGRHALYEASDLLRRGLALLENELKESQRYTRYGADMYTVHAMILQVTEGYGVPELEEVYGRALDLVRELEEKPRLLSVLWSLWGFQYVQGYLDIALDYAGQILTAAEQSGLMVWRIGGHLAQSVTLLSNGEAEKSLIHACRAIELYELTGHKTLFYHFFQDPGVSAWYCKAHSLWLLGFADQAETAYQNTLALAETIDHPYTHVIALIASAQHYVDRREPDRVIEYCEILETLSADYGFAAWHAISSAMRGWALAMQGQAEQGAALIQQGLASWQETRSRTYETRCLVQLAEAQAENGRPDLGLTTLTEALRATQYPGEKYYEAEVHRLQGQLLLRVDSSDQLAAEKCFLEALAVARRQAAKSLELRAANSLARLWMERGRTQEATEMLCEIYNWFSEGYDTVDLRNTEALLAEMAEHRSTLALND